MSRYEREQRRFDSYQRGQFAPVAQQADAGVSKALGYRFESCQEHHPSITQMARVPALNRRDPGSMPGRGTNFVAEGEWHSSQAVTLL